MAKRLSNAMTVPEFDNGYWYALELKKFAAQLGISSASAMRKDELERAIRQFLKTGKLRTVSTRKVVSSGPRDSARPLSVRRRVVNYTNNKETKTFLDTAAERLAPGLQLKSGTRYRLNRWRESQLAAGVPITYGDLVKEYVRLNATAKPFARIPHVRYINFLSDFLAHEKGATRQQGIAAWRKLKAMDVPKEYRAWVKAGGKR